MNTDILPKETINETLSQYIRENKKNGILKLIKNNINKISLLDVKYNHYKNIYYYCYREDKPFSNKNFFDFIQNFAKDEIYLILTSFNKTNILKTIINPEQYNIKQKIDPVIMNNTFINNYIESNSENKKNTVNTSEILFHQIDAIQKYHETGFDLNQTFYNNNNIAHLYFKNTKEHITKKEIDIFLKLKIDLLQVNDYGLTPLHYLISLKSNMIQKKRIGAPRTEQIDDKSIFYILDFFKDKLPTFNPQNIKTKTVFNKERMMRKKTIEIIALNSKSQKTFFNFTQEKILNDYHKNENIIGIFNWFIENNNFNKKNFTSLLKEITKKQPISLNTHKIAVHIVDIIKKLKETNKNTDYILNEIIDTCLNIKSNSITSETDKKRYNLGKAIFNNLQKENIVLDTQKPAQNKAKNSIEFLNKCLPLKLPNGEILKQDSKIIYNYVENQHLKQTLNNSKKNKKQIL